jgi:isoleucyl-tRNA synthetase
MFREINKSESFPSLEERILSVWDADNSFKQSVEQNDENNSFVFFDGPPFATGLPHYGHLLAGTIKDIVPRYWTMKGKQVRRRFGWDCHGLPIESLIQNELKLSGVADIKAFGVDNFNESCRSSVLKYTDEWRQTVRRMGRWVDFDNDYKTMDPGFMESVWWVFKQCWDKNLIYQGYRIQPYSPSLATPLSNFETNQGYKDRQDPSLTVIMPNNENSHASENFLVWTTTPWTLPSNMVIAVGANIDYCLVQQGEQSFWLAESRLSAYFKDVESLTITKRCKGQDLAGTEYKPLFNYIPNDLEGAKHLYKVVCADFVSTENGTGTVHIAPSFGEDDFILGKQMGLPLFDPLDAEGKFTAMVPEWAGLGAKDADKDIIAHLKAQHRVFKHDTLVHSYPHCYRTGVPLLYRALKTWFLRLDGEITNAQGVTKTLKQWMIDCNQQINWVPGHIKDGRFGNWLEGARDWNISRNRFWGAPLPVWIEELDASETRDPQMIAIGSVQELEALSGITVEDLHKHIVDEIVIRTKDGKTFDAQGTVYRRTEEVFDCWFESGSMPYAQNHYPFENKDYVEANFPADFIAEGLDQTRGWFYTLTVLSAAIFQKPAFNNVIVNGIILAEDGQKMSKSLRNYPDPNDLINRTGADAIRLFMINSAALKAEDLRFSEIGVKEIVKTVMLPLWNAVSFFITNHNADYAKQQLNWKPSLELLQGKGLLDTNELDQWILANLQDLLENIETEMQAYRLYNVVPALVQFIDSLTNWYLRRSRRRFWKSENDGDKNAAYGTLYYVLATFSKALAPFLPFLSEEMYQMLVREPIAQAPASVHLNPFPTPQQSLRNPALVQKMSKVESVVLMGRTLRAANDLKNRQPLSALTVVCRNAQDQQDLLSMKDIILEELNVKELLFSNDESSLVELSAKANFKSLGKRMGKSMKDVNAAIMQFSAEQITALQAGISIFLEWGDIQLEDIIIQRQVQEGMVVDADEHFTIALDTRISEELAMECDAREFVNRVQNRRKELDLQITDTIRVHVYQLDSSSSLAKTLQQKHLQQYIAGETLIAGENLTVHESTDFDAANCISTTVNGAEFMLEVCRA